MIRQIVGRCHVSDSNLAVIRYVISCMAKPGYQTYRKLDKTHRRKLLEKIIECHKDNREVYHFATRGTWPKAA